MEKVFSTAAPPPFLFVKKNLFLSFLLLLLPSTYNGILITPHCPVPDVGQNKLSCANVTRMQLERTETVSFERDNVWYWKTFQFYSLNHQGYYGLQKNNVLLLWKVYFVSLNLYTYMDQVWAGFHTCPCLRTMLLSSHFMWMVTKSWNHAVSVTKLMSYHVSDRLTCRLTYMLWFCIFIGCLRGKIAGEL